MSATSHLPGVPCGLAELVSDTSSAVAARRRNRAAKQGALVQAALKLFSEKGYEATTTREIAAAAGCAEGLIHRYFQGKAGLLTAIIQHHASRDLADLNRDLLPAADLEQEFIQLVLWRVERVWESRDFLRVFLPRAFADAKVRNVMSRAVLSVRATAFRDRLRRFESALRLPAEELETLAQSVSMLGFLFGFVRPSVLGQDRERARKTAAKIAKMLIRGVRLA
jgi:TetR/AcrR family transcriptional regulator, regulator of cefoperazone and chloramphenicol sensitivity